MLKLLACSRRYCALLLFGDFKHSQHVRFSAENCLCLLLATCSYVLCTCPRCLSRPLQPAHLAHLSGREPLVTHEGSSLLYVL